MSKCKDQIFSDYHYRPCQRNSGESGYCSQHDPEKKAIRQKAQNEKRDRQSAERVAIWRRERLVASFCEGVTAETLKTLIDGGINLAKMLESTK